MANLYISSESLLRLQNMWGKTQTTYSVRHYCWYPEWHETPAAIYLDIAVIDVVAASLQASDADELLARPLGYATSIIRKTIGAVTNDSVWFNIELLKNEPENKWLCLMATMEIYDPIILM